MPRAPHPHDPAEGRGPEERTETLTGAEPSTPFEALPGADFAAISLLPRGALAGRFVVLDVIGSGGMGVVYAAYDPELGRKVALKLIRLDRRERFGAESRLLREAQALARLSHPNVITLYDVGLLEARLFLAMEHVQGLALDAWLAAAPRRRREILRVFLEAGRGLAAAHAAGLVHRDFKPGNVLVADDGRVLVLDFGLARTVGAEPGPEGEVVELEALSRTPGGPVARDLTRTGARLGTPAYMAPEQRRGETVGPAADQYSFALALSEALAAAGVRAHRGLHRALARSLAENPAGRFPALEPILREIDRGLHLARRRAFQASLAAALLLLPAAGALLRETAATRRALCGGAAERLQGVWDPSRRGAVRTAFAAAGTPLAPSALRGVERALDTYAADWVAMRTEACRATRFRGEQSEELLDRRMACLEQRRRELASFVDLLARADAGLVRRAPEAALGLPSLSACADASALLAPFREPASPEARKRIAAVRGTLARVRALQQAAAYKPGLALAAEAVRRAEGIEFWPLTAEALLVQGEIEERGGRPEDAAAALHRSLLAAEAGRHDRVAVEAFARLVRVAGYLQAQHEESHRYARQGLSLLAHLDRREILEATLADHEGTVFFQQGDLAAALERHRRSLTLRRQALGPGHPQVADTLIRIGNVLAQQGDLEGALLNYRSALAIKEKVLGPDHPDVAQVLDIVGGLLFRRAAYAEALALHRRSLAIGERILGPDASQVAATLTHLGNAYAGLGRTAEALACQRRSVAVFEKNLGPNHPNVGFALNNLGLKLLELGDPAAAKAALRRALSIQVATYGPGHPWVAQAELSLGEAEREQGLYRQALARYRRALAIWERELGSEHYLVGYALTGLGEAQLALGSPEAGLPNLERALSLLGREEIDPLVLAEARFALARTLEALRRDPLRVQRLAGEARAASLAAGPGGRRQLAEVEAWLARRVHKP